MLTLVIAVLGGAGSAVSLWMFKVMHGGWAVCCGIGVFLAIQFIAGRILNKRVQAIMNDVQLLFKNGQRKIEAKMNRWRMNPPGGMNEIRKLLDKEQAQLVSEALEMIKKLQPYRLWVMLLDRQIASAQVSFNWMAKRFKLVDQYIDKALFFDPYMQSIKLARMFMLDASTQDILKTYEKFTKRAKYNANVMPAASVSWMLVKRGDADGAFKLLNAALTKSDNPVLKSNREHLANNRLNKFSNAGLEDQWSSLFLEEPKIKAQRVPQSMRFAR
jgi:hypothetical protein